MYFHMIFICGGIRLNFLENASRLMQKSLSFAKSILHQNAFFSQNEYSNISFEMPSKFKQNLSRLVSHMLIATNGTVC